jgi:hypothetical protein
MACRKLLVEYSTYGSIEFGAPPCSVLQKQRIQHIEDIGLEQLDAFRAGRKVGPKTSRNGSKPSGNFGPSA